MSSFAATAIPDAATHGNSLAGLAVVLVLVLVVVAAGYLTRCWLFPFTPCHHRYAFNRRVCRRCQSTGIRLRAGRRFLNHIRATRRH
jgi:hypothetical protein